MARSSNPRPPRRPRRETFTLPPPQPDGTVFDPRRQPARPDLGKTPIEPPPPPGPMPNPAPYGD